MRGLIALVEAVDMVGVVAAIEVDTGDHPTDIAPPSMLAPVVTIIMTAAETIVSITEGLTLTTIIV